MQLSTYNEPPTIQQIRYEDSVAAQCVQIWDAQHGHVEARRVLQRSHDLAVREARILSAMTPEVLRVFADEMKAARLAAK